MATAAPTPRAWIPDDPWNRTLTWMTRSHARAVAMLLALSLLTFLPGFFNIPPVDRDEARFAQATKQMLENGDFIDIRFQDEVRYKKPVGIYWMQAAAVRVGEALGVPQARTRIWLYRLPSLLGAMGAVLLTYWAALAFVPRRQAVLAAAMIATSLLLGFEARLAKTDAVLLLAIVAAMGALARAYLGLPDDKQDIHRRVVMPAMFWGAIAVGILVKGPIILLFVGLAALTLIIVDRSAGWLWALRPLIGIPFAAVLVLPWFLAILSRAGGQFLAESIGRDMLGKVVSGQESHGAPPGFYFVLFWLTFWPAAPLAALSAPALWHGRAERPIRFLIAWIVPAWIVFELVVTKLPHYVLPLYPAIAIAIAVVLARGEVSGIRWLRLTRAWWPAVATILTVAALVLFVMLRRQLNVAAWPFAAGAIVCGCLAWRHFRRTGPERALLWSVWASVLVSFTIFGLIIPRLQPAFPAATVASVLKASGCASPELAAAGYHEPSLVFLAGTATRLTDGAAAAEFLAHGPCRFALIEGRQERAFVARADAIALRYTAGMKIDGFNLGGGRSISLAIYRSAGER